MASPSTVAVASMAMGIGEIMLTVHARLSPHNKDFSRFRHRVGRRLAATRLRGPMLWLEDRIGYGKRLRPRDWWAGRDGRPA